MKIMKSYRIYLIVALIFSLFLVLRLISLSNVNVLEDHDSLLYLKTIETFRTADIKEIMNIDPDASLVFAFAGAVVSAIAGSIELSARLVSLLAGIGIFFIAYIIGKRFDSENASLTGLILIALNPALIGLSIAVLTEPLYVTVVYSGLLLFILYHKNLRFLPSFFIGIVFGLALLTRLEGILFLIFIPLAQALYLIIEKKFKSNLRRYIVWTTLFISGFLLVTAIQVSWVSHKMGTLALDGRQVWTLIMHEPGDRPLVERLLGLDYDPANTNIGYLKSNPGAIEVTRESNIKDLFYEYTKTSFWNLHDLYNNRLADLVGFAILIFFALGVIKLYKTGKIFEIFLVFLFIITGLIAPILHNVVIRHILVIGPIILIVAGIGLYGTVQYIVKEMQIDSVYRYSLLIIICLFILSVWALPINLNIKMPAINREYDPEIIQRMATIIEDDNELQHEIAVSARKGYLPYYSGSRNVITPYTDYDGLVKYLYLNNVTYLFLEHAMLERFPFIESFNNESYTDDFILLYETVDNRGRNYSLYKVISNER